MPEARTRLGELLGGMETPDITKAQLVALAEAVLAVAAALGFDLSDGERNSLFALAAVVAAFLTGADAYIRNGRARAAGAREQFQKAAGDVRREFGREAPKP